MIGKLVMTALMIFGLVKPELFLKVTEFWKLGRKAPNANTLKATQVLCGIAIVCIWIFL